MPTILMHLPRRRSSSWRGAKRGCVVTCGVVARRWWRAPGAGPYGDGHACLPRALAVRATNDDPAVLSDGGLLAQRARRRWDARVETLVQQARTLILSGTHGNSRTIKLEHYLLIAAMCSWSCAVVRIPSWLPRWLSTRWQSERFLKIFSL